jgi:hypothetical protein
MFGAATQGALWRGSGHDSHVVLKVPLSGTFKKHSTGRATRSRDILANLGDLIIRGSLSSRNPHYK